MEFFSYFVPIFKAVFVIIIIGVASGILLRKGIITNEQIKALSHITVIVLLPCLTFAKIVQYFKPHEFTYWWVLPLLAVVMISLGIGITSLFYLRQLKAKRAFIGISAFMNANYMVLPIGQLVFKNQFDQFATYTFLFVMGVIPMLWSVGKFMITSDEHSKFSIKDVLNPMFITTTFAVLVVLSGLNKYIPDIVMTPIDFMGQAAIPSVTLVLGATLGSIALRQLPSIIDILKVLSTRLFIMPVITILILLQTNLGETYPLIADLLVIQASVAPATQLIIQVKKYGGNVQSVGGMMLVAYMVCLATIPSWFFLWNMLKQ